MNDRAKKSFREKAPLVDENELSEIISSEIMAEGLKKKTESVWIIGSFANPDKRLDTNKVEWSDLDIFIVVPEWEYPQADTGIVLHATDATLPEFVERNVESNEWSGTDGPKKWNCSADTAWERIPEYARRTLSNGVKNGFFRSAEELDSGKVRYFDIFIGTREQLEFQRQLDLSAQNEPPGFRLQRMTTK